MNTQQDEDFFETNLFEEINNQKLEKRKELKNENADIKSKPQDISRVIACEKCNGTGAVLKTDEAHYIYAYRCNCANQSKKPNLRNWSY